MNVLKLLLYPLAAIYNGVTRLRNHLYDIGQKSSFEFETSVVSVGNLNVGGSGKTPMVEYLVEQFGNRFPIVTLSRGYKRDTTGFRVAAGDDTALSIGDEPYQLFRKFGQKIHVAVGEDRVYAIPNILMEFPETKLLILDDAFQHRAIIPNISILLTSFDLPFFRDYLVPFGRLREARSGARRADVVVVTKCPDSLTEGEQNLIRKRIQTYAGAKPILFANITYGEPVPVRSNRPVASRIILVSGIAQAGPLLGYCKKKFEVIHHFCFADHHRYTQQDLEAIEKRFRDGGGSQSILTTEKDMARLDCPEFTEFLDRLPWYSLPVRQAFLKDGSKFDALVLQAIERASKQ